MLADIVSDPTVAITIFAPTDAAFEGFLASQNWTLSDLLDSDYLRPFMEYHMVPAIIPIEEMMVGEELPTMFIGQNLTLSAPVNNLSLFTVNAEESTADIILGDIPAGQVSHQHLLDMS